MAEPVHRDVTAGGVRLRVAEHGEGPPVLALHGLFADHTTWDRVAQLLASDFRIIAPDLPGFGASEKPRAQRFPYGVDAFAEAVADLYAGLRLSRVAVIGHGLGGAVAITLAARHPELVSRLVLVDPLCYQAVRDVRMQLLLAPVVGGLFFRQLLGGALFRSFWRRTMTSTSDRVLGSQIDHFYDMFNTPAARGSTLATLRATTDMRPVVALLTRIQAETLVVWGRSDRMYAVSLGHRLVRAIRGAGLQVLDAGHCPQEECPQDLAAVVRRFLKAERPSLT